MLDKERIAIENDVLDKLSGKIYLLQDLTHKYDVIFQAFLEVYNSPRCQKFVNKSNGLDLDNFFKEFLGYGVVDEFLADPEVEDIMINHLFPVYVHKTKTGLLKTDKFFSSREELDLFVKKLVIFSGRKEIKKINNVELSDIKGRANIIFSPFGPQITITRAKEKTLSVIELMETGALNAELGAQFWLYMEGLGVKPANIIISGGPGTGKTTLLNALFSFIPVQERIVIIEDTLELNTDIKENCSRLECDDQVTMADLVKNSLRMRPDRIIVGEVRGSEAQDLMTAMNVGKYCIGTIHAATARETITRIQNEPMNVPEVLVNLIDVFVIMRRYGMNGRNRRVIGELVETAGMERKTVLLSPLWTFNFPANKFSESAISSIYRDKLAQLSGKSAVEIMDELKIRAAILNALLNKGIKDFKAVTEFCRFYIADNTAALNELGLKRANLLR